MQTCWWPLSDHWSVQSTSPHLSGFVFYGCLESLTELSALCGFSVSPAYCLGIATDCPCGFWCWSLCLTKWSMLFSFFFLSCLHTQAHYTTPRHTTPHTTHHAIHTYIVVISRDISISHFCYRLFSCHLVFHISRVSLYYIFFIDVAAWLSWNKAIAMECYKGNTEWYPDITILLVLNSINLTRTPKIRRR